MAMSPDPQDPARMIKEAERGRGAPVLFSAMSKPRQLWESLGGAVVTGAVCGLLLTVVWWGYLIGVIVTFVGGSPAGSQHRTLLGALARGFVGGVVWAVTVLAVLALTGRGAVIPLPDPTIAFLPYGFIPACVVAAIAWTISRRRRKAQA